MITNISFDLWLTLIRSHPQFKAKRAEMIADTYNPKGYSAEQIDVLIRNMDKIFDRFNESSGKKISADKMYLKILCELCDNEDSLTLADGKKVEQAANDLFIEYTPQLLNQNTPQILEYLKDNGRVLNLSSNTGFIEGNTLSVVLRKLDLSKYFSFFVFSDEIGVSKPSPLFFQEVYGKANVPKSQILHIGDNAKTDYQGAIDFGFQALLIKHNYTLDDIRARL